MGRLSGMQGRRSRVPPLVGNPSRDFTRNFFLQKCPRPDWRNAQSLWCWSPCTVVADFLDCWGAFMEGAPQGVEAIAVWLEDCGRSPEGAFGSLAIKLRAIARWAVHGMTGSPTEDCCPILSVASSRKGWESMALVIGAVSHPSRDETARRMGQHQHMREVDLWRSDCS